MWFEAPQHPMQGQVLAIATQPEIKWIWLQEEVLDAAERDCSDGAAET